jgi:hypothetical protein
MVFDFGAFIAGVTVAAVIGFGFWWSARAAITPSVAQAQYKQLINAQTALVEEEALLEYYRVHVPMLRAQIKRLELAAEKREKTRQQQATSAKINASPV